MKSAWARKSSSMTFLYRVVLFLTWCFFKLFYCHRVYGIGRFPKGAGIIAANHGSFYDPPLLAISSPEEVHFLARSTLFKNHFFGSLIRNLNAHPVKGGGADIGVFRMIQKLLLEGKKVILFPEGTRSKTPQLGPLKPGVATLVSKSNAAVIPVYIAGAFKIWNRFHKFPHLIGKTACVFGKPIYLSEFAHLEKREAEKALLDALTDSIQALCDWYERGAKGPLP